jgi:hypothetical protein
MAASSSSSGAAAAAGEGFAAAADEQDAQQWLINNNVEELLPLADPIQHWQQYLDPAFGGLLEVASSPSGQAFGNFGFHEFTQWLDQLTKGRFTSKPFAARNLHRSYYHVNSFEGLLQQVQQHSLPLSGHLRTLHEEGKLLALFPDPDLPDNEVGIMARCPFCHGHHAVNMFNPQKPQLLATRLANYRQCFSDMHRAGVVEAPEFYYLWGRFWGVRGPTLAEDNVQLFMSPRQLQEEKRQKSHVTNFGKGGHPVSGWRKSLQQQKRKDETPLTLAQQVEKTKDKYNWFEFLSAHVLAAVLQAICPRAVFAAASQGSGAFASGYSTLHLNNQWLLKLQTHVRDPCSCVKCGGSRDVSLVAPHMFPCRKVVAQKPPSKTEAEGEGAAAAAAVADAAGQ